MKQQTRSRIASGLDRVGLLPAAARLREGWLARRTPESPETSPDGLPLPPPRLRLLVDGRSGDARRFLLIGRTMFETIAAAAADLGRPVESLGDVLDFGCGCGRVARCWSGVQGPRLHGCDYNPDLADWCAENLPFMDASRNEVAPPTPYADGSFDLIYALSVFSHLSEPLQGDWVRELRRVLRPGGMLVISVLGEAARDRLSSSEAERFACGELIVERPRMAGHNVCTAYHPPGYVTGELLAEFSEVRRFDLGSPSIPLGQDAYIARM